MLSSPPPPTSPSSTSSSIISNTITTTATAAAAAITTTSTSLNIINTSDLSASAITPGSNHHNNSNRHLNLNYHNNYNHNQSTNYNNYNHLPSEMSPSAPAIGATPIDMVIVSGSTTTTSSSSTNTSSSSSSTPPPTSASLLAINNIGNSNTSTTANTLCSSSSSLSISSTITTTTTATASSSSSSTTTTTTVKQANMMSMVMIKECLCVGCKQPIRDRYLMSINEHYWHESCLQCTVCRIMLTNSCYVKERKIYCKNDYNKLYATKCTNCLESINSNELVMRVHEYIYHLSCFICIWCKRQLKKGDKFALRGHQPICEIDLTKTSDTHHSHHLLTTLNNVNNNIEQSSHLSILNHDINYDMINGLSPPSSTAAMTNDKSLHLTMLQPSSIGHDNNNISDHHQYSPRTLTICDSSMINKNERQQSQPAPSLPLTSTNSQQSYSSPSSHNTSNCNNNSTNNINNNNSPLPIKQDGRRGPKRPRTILTTAQRRAFKASFDVSQKPCRKVRETLAKETGLSVRIVQVWFQNQRAKLKKIQRKQQQQQLAQGGGGLLIGNGSESGGGIGSSDKSRDDTSDEDDVDDESQQFSIPYLLQSPDAGSYYSGRGEDDGFTVKSEMGCMDDSETSLCEMDDNNCMRSSNSDSDHRSSLSSSTAAAAATTATTLPFGALSMIGTNINTNSNISSNNSHLSTTNHIMFSPPPPPLSSSTTSQCIPIQHHNHNNNHHHHPHHHHHHQQQSNILHLTNNTQLSNSTTTTTATSITNMTPIDKLYSMQNSYFNNNPPSECEC